MVATFLSDPAVVLVVTLIRDLAFVVHAGAIITFACLAALSHRVGGPPRARILRVYQAFGPGLGISLGLLVFTALLLHYAQVGAFDWSPTPATGGAVGLAAWVVFFVAWASNIRLEVWTLEPLRKLDPDGTTLASDANQLDRARAAVALHLVMQGILWATILILTRIAVGT
ncbi:MAG: hypothetical protein CL927_18820 [Deltaproteobacteria bacterium]|nr:hypothetical protein [Deltaproteobacteria bacterium]